MAPGAEYDVAIVGASIAGCTAAALLGRAGAKVALVERQSSPDAYKTVCTHFIQASATPTIERLGLAEPIEAAGGVRNGLEIWSRYGWARPQPEPSDPHPSYGYDIRREKLDPMVRGLAAETPGVELLQGWTATELLNGGGRPRGVGVRDRSGAERELTARVTVGADGRESRVARMAGVPGRVKPHGRFGYFAYYRDLPLVSGNRTLFWFLDPQVAYAFPQDDGLTLLAVFQTRDRLPWFRRDAEGNFLAAFDGLPNAPDLASGRRVSKLIGKLEMPNVMRPAARPGVAFAGDAALAADPLWGVGCGFAFQSGEWLADALAGELGGSDAAVDAALARYGREHRRRLLAHHLMISDYSTGRRFSATERLFFASAAKDDRTALGLHALGTRSIRPTDRAFARVIGRAAWVAATHRRGPTDAPALAGPLAEGAALPAGVRRGSIAIGPVRTPVSEAGPADAAEGVLFLHGNPGSSRDWDDLLSRTGAFARAVALDMPGFGRADKPADFPYTVEGYAAFLGRALERLGLRRVHLVLHDFGGPWGLEWAARHPGAVASMTLIDTGALFTPWHYLARIWRTRGVGEAFMATTTRAGLRLLLRHGNPRGLPRAFVDRMFDDLDAGTKRALLRLYRSLDDPAAVGRRHAEALRPLDLPGCVMWGAHDPYLDAGLAERQREMLPRAEVHVLEGSGHWPMADDPEGTARIVMPFLEARLRAPSSPATG